MRLREKPMLEGSYTIQGGNFDEFEISPGIGMGTHLKTIVRRNLAP